MSSGPCATIWRVRNMKYEIVRAKAPVEKVIMEFTEQEIRNCADILSRIAGFNFSWLFERFSEVRKELDK